jgi:hypothetical protein
VIFFSFISPRSSRRNDPTQVASERTDEDEFYVLKKAEDLVADLSFAIRSLNDRWTCQNDAHIIEIDLAVPQDCGALFRIPTEVTYAREQLFEIFRHSDHLTECE